MINIFKFYGKAVAEIKLATLELNIILLQIICTGKLICSAFNNANHHIATKC
jgi:hypothetical protein